MKASDIKNKALAEILSFAVYELTQIVQHRIAIGEVDEDENGIYEEELFGYGLPTYTYDVFVEDPYTDAIITEKRTLKGFQLDGDAVYVLAEEEDYNEQDPIALRSLSTDDITGLVDVLEQMWNNLIKK